MEEKIITETAQKIINEIEVIYEVILKKIAE